MRKTLIIALTLALSVIIPACGGGGGGGGGGGDDSGQVPNSPSSLQVTNTTSSSVSLSWTDNSNDEDGFYIERASSGSGPFSLVASVGANTQTFTENSLSASTNYYYRVCAHNSAGSSSYSNVVLAATTSGGGGGTPPSSPTGLSASAASSSSINLAWTDNASNESAYYVERSTSSSSGFSQIASLSANVTSYTATGLSASTTYYFRVRAYNSAGYSGYSNTANATTLSGVSVPSTPSGLTATAASSSSINLYWTDNAGNETAYYVERSTSPSSGFSQIASLGANSASYTATGLSVSTTYYFRVRAYNSAGYSGYSNTANATTLSGVTVPNAPSSLSASTISSSSIGLTWVDNSNNETGFAIFRSGSASGTFIQVATVGANVTSYTNTGLSAATTYYYRVQSYNSAGNSASSNTASATTSTATGTLRITNNTHYYMVDLRLNSVQQLYYPYVLNPEGGYQNFTYSPGNVSYALGVGFYDGSSRDVWFTYTGTATVLAGQTTTVTFPNPTIGQLLTNFSTYKDWNGSYFDNNYNLHTTRYRIYSGGSYYFYIDGNQQTSGTVSLISWPTHSTYVTFNLRGGSTTIYYPFGTFYKTENLSSTWPIIEYN